MSRRVALFMACLSLSVAARGEGLERRLRFEKTVTRPEAAGEAIIAAPLDSEVYAATRAGFSDVRLIDDHDAEVPYVVEHVAQPRKPVVVREPCPARVESLHIEEGKALEVVVTLEKDARPADGATIQTPLTDFERRVRVYGDRDGEWVVLNDDGRIFDYSRFMNVRNRDVALANNGFRSYRIVVDRERDERESPLRELIRDRGRGVETDITSSVRRPFRIDRIDLWRNVERDGGSDQEAMLHPIAIYHVKDDARTRATWVDVETGRRPLSGLRLKTSSRNFSRSARALVPNDRGGREDWIEIGRGSLALFAFRGFQREETTIDFPERRDDRCRLVIDNADNPPLEVTGVEGRGVDLQIVFLGEPARRYRLLYGGDGVEAPRYDAAAVLGVIGRGRVPSPATLGPQRANSDYRPAFHQPRVVDGGTAMVLAVIATVAVLAWALANAGRRLRKSPPDGFDG